jgi:hypothetical protein
VQAAVADAVDVRQLRDRRTRLILRPSREEVIRQLLAEGVERAAGW